MSKNKRERVKKSSHARGPSGPQLRAARFRLLGVLTLAVAAVVWFTLAPALSAQATFSDDPAYLSLNPLVQNPGWESARRFLSEVTVTSTVGGYYHPLTMISLMLDYWVAGGAGDLGPFHRTSLVLHILNTALVVGLLYLLFGEPWAAAAAGLLFGVHPRVVEQVAWISERKTVLATCFALGSLVLYVLYARRRGWRLYAGALAAYTLALLAKPTALPLPVMMLVLDYWPLRRVGRAAVIEKVPFAVVGGVLGIITVVSQVTGSEPVAASAVGAWRTVSVLCYSVYFYLAKSIWPVHLLPYDPPPAPLTLSHPLVAAGAVIIVLIVAALLVSLRWTRAAVVGGLLFFVALMPTMGNAVFSDILVANRYAYMPMLGLLVPIAGGLSHLWSRARQTSAASMRRTIGMSLVLALAAAEIVGARAYLAHWGDTVDLMRYMVTQAPASAPLHCDLGLALSTQGQAAEAIAEYQTAVRLDPDFAEAHGNLAVELAKRGDTDAAVLHFRAALRSRPGDAATQLNLGLALTQQQKFDEAAAQFLGVLRVDPNRAEAHAHLAVALGMQGESDAAIRELRAAIRIKPDVADWHTNLGRLLERAGKPAEAAAEFDQAARLASRNQGR